MSGQARQAILPFFIPMQGCAHQCVYCDQRSISGQADAPLPKKIEAAALAYKGTRPAQLAFYGGSFTALPLDVQQQYLQAAQPALKQGIIESLRVSTRPDAIDEATLDFLASWGVSTVELGIQSFDLQVLKQSGRAYAPDTAARACQLVRAAGLTLGIQLMTGLPGDDRAKSLRSMWQSCDLRPAFMRLYPTVVLRGTPLAVLYQRGQYLPQTLTEAAVLAADMLALALSDGIPVIRLGLNPSPSLEEALIAGPYHPAFGQLARSALKLKQARTLLNQAQQPLTLYFPKNDRPLLFGQKNSQWLELQQQYPGLKAEAADAALPPGALQATFSDNHSLMLAEVDFLRQYAAALRAEI